MDEFYEARLAWDNQYKKGRFLQEPIHQEMPRIVQRFKRHGVQRILDLGCGGGRHTLFLAQQGFEIFSLDIAPSGLNATIQKLASEALIGHVTLADIIQLPYHDAVFDAIISVRVIHHNRIADIKRSVDEIWRILKPHGLCWITVPVPEGHGSKDGQEIEPGTWVPTRGIEQGLPHHLFTEDELQNLFQRFRILTLHVLKKNHYSLLVEKPPD